MAWSATVQEPISILPEGEYDAMTVDIRQAKGPHGQIVRIDFMIESEEEGEGRLVSGVASKRLSENTKLGRWMAAVLGRPLEVGEQLSPSDVMHRNCRVVVKHKANGEGQVYANVVQVLPPMRKK